MTTTRHNRRARHKRHKARARNHVIRLWGARRLGYEFIEMLRWQHEVNRDAVVFIDGPIAGDLRAVEYGQRTFEVCVPRDGAMRRMIKRDFSDVPYYDRYRYEILFVGEVHEFYDGRNFRTRTRRVARIIQPSRPSMMPWNAFDAPGKSPDQIPRI